MTRPLFVTHAPGDADRIYIVEKPGRIKVLKGGVVSVFLDITARVGGSGSLNSEQGLFALAFHPDFANNSFFYVNYTNNGGDTRVSRFTANDADNGDSGSEFVILSISQPQSNHNGGWLAFGPNDGFLYIATGDASRNASMFEHLSQQSDLFEEVYGGPVQWEELPNARASRIADYRDGGDVTILPADVEKNFDKITNSVRRILQKGAFPVIVGGDHSITFPAVKAFDRYNPLDVVHFDAHLDFTHELQGTFYSHGCPIRRCYELPFVRHIASIGIRTAAKIVYDEAVEKGVKVITTAQVRQQGPRQVIEGLQASGDIYVTFDVDVMDPVQIPGTGTPVVGGLTYHEMREALTALASKGRIVGFDVVE
ncbi:MAG: DUF4268 domain-containing protein, partial [Planctomycetes bacterium]|nr:DUF4268 domain-containing protein [Planctomycetota bacterium]